MSNPLPEDEIQSQKRSLMRNKLGPRCIALLLRAAHSQTLYLSNQLVTTGHYYGNSFGGGGGDKGRAVRIRKPICVTAQQQELQPQVILHFSLNEPIHGIRHHSLLNVSIETNSKSHKLCNQK